MLGLPWSKQTSSGAEYLLRSIENGIEGQSPRHLGFPGNLKKGQPRCIVEAEYRYLLRALVGDLFEKADCVEISYRHRTPWTAKPPYRDLENVLLYNLLRSGTPLPPKLRIGRVHQSQSNTENLVTYRSVAEVTEPVEMPVASATATFVAKDIKELLTIWLPFRRLLAGSGYTTDVRGEFDVLLRIATPSHLPMTVARFKKFLDGFISALHFQDRSDLPSSLPAIIGTEATELLTNRNGAVLGPWCCPTVSKRGRLVWSPADHLMRSCIVVTHASRDEAIHAKASVYPRLV